MPKNLNLKTQLIILASFFVFFYVFFALASSIYRDYRLESHIAKFEADIAHMETLVYNKPNDIAYYESIQFKDKYAKENLNLINPGEKLIIIPKEDQNVRPEFAPARYENEAVLSLPHPQQWWAYFFGQTLTVQ